MKRGHPQLWKVYDSLPMPMTEHSYDKRRQLLPPPSLLPPGVPIETSLKSCMWGIAGQSNLCQAAKGSGAVLTQLQLLLSDG